MTFLDTPLNQTQTVVYTIFTMHIYKFESLTKNQKIKRFERNILLCKFAFYTHTHARVCNVCIDLFKEFNLF